MSYEKYSEKKIGEFERFGAVDLKIMELRNNIETQIMDDFSRIVDINVQYDVEPTLKRPVEVLGAIRHRRGNIANQVKEQLEEWNNKE